MRSPTTPERPQLSSPVLGALERALGFGFFGGGPLETQILHAWEFGTCAEEFLGSDTSGDHDVGAYAGSFREQFLDLGSGGGLPGLVLADRWQACRAVLLDANLRKAAALEEAIGACGWQRRVSVLQSRAEVAGRSALRGTFDLVVARSFAPPPVTAECAAPFLRPGGLLVVSEPPTDSVATKEGVLLASDPVRWPSVGLAIVGLEPLSAWRGRFGFQVLRQAAPCPERFPRREGIPNKRPIYVSKVPGA
jgi:16S rRNA (guanine527-N7)-methyltransferase